MYKKSITLSCLVLCLAQTLCASEPRASEAVPLFKKGDLVTIHSGYVQGDAVVQGTVASSVEAIKKAKKLILSTSVQEYVTKTRPLCHNKEYCKKETCTHASAQDSIKQIEEMSRIS